MARAASPVDGSTQQDLLQRLISEGLTPSAADDDPSKYRKLLEVLFSACVLNQVGEPLVPITLEQAGYTLTILSRQTRSRPELLSLLPSPGEPQLPFYKWILPRLIHGASKFAGVEGAEQLTDELCSAAVDVLRVLTRDLSEHDGDHSNGLHRSVHACQALSLWTQGALEGRSHALFGFDLASDMQTIILALHILLELQVPFTDLLSLAACNRIGDATRQMRQASVPQQRRLMRVISGALSTDLARPELCSAVVGAVKIGVGGGQSLARDLRTLLEAVERGDEDSRLQVWWALYDDVEAIDIAADPPSAEVAIFLLLPIGDQLPASALRQLVSKEVLDRWVDQAPSADPEARYRFGVRSRALILGDEVPTLKRKRRSCQHSVTEFVAEHLPRLQPEDDDDLATLLSRRVARADDQSVSDLRRRLARLVCLMVDCSQHQPPFQTTSSPAVLDLWCTLATTTAPDAYLMQALCVHIDHSQPQDTAATAQTRPQVLDLIFNSARSTDRAVRSAAGRAISAIFHAQQALPDSHLGANNRTMMVHRTELLLQASFQARASAISILGDIALVATGDDVGRILEILLTQLGSSAAPLKGLAYAQLVNLSKSRNKTPYSLISPHLERISVLIAKNLVRKPDLVAEALQFIGQTRQNFLETTLRFTIPALVLSRNLQALEQVAAIIRQGLGLILLDQTAAILATIFLHPRQTKDGLRFLVELLQGLMKGQKTAVISPSSLMTTCIVPFVVSLTVELGDEDEAIAKNATEALYNAQREQSQGAFIGSDLGPFLKPHMLGIISHLNETLHDLQGRKTVAFKRKVIRSLGALIQLVGDSMSSFSPQIIASLQSTLGIPELRTETLKTWRLFIETLRYSDIGPYVGRTTAALGAHWSSFDQEQKQIALHVINNIAENAQNLAGHLDEIVGISGIPELQEASAKLTDYRRSWSFAQQVDKLLDRARSKNAAVSTMSLSELRTLLLAHQIDVQRLSQGDTFDPLVSRVMAELLSAATRDGDYQELRDLAYECLGILGAVDPDRLVTLSEPTSMTLLSNFSDPEESTDFAVHLIRDLLVGAFRATNDTKHQNHLAYAIQELLKYCGFTPKVLSDGATSLKTRGRWLQLHKDQHEILAPLLESRFSLSEVPPRSFTYPIYSQVQTYREWIQMWTTDLIAKVMSWHGDDRATRDSKMIFGVMRGVLRNQDVTVAHHILPHLVLNVLLSGISSSRNEIWLEINTVLQDQVNPTGSVDKRTLSAQVVFDLLDHLSKWLRMQRRDRSDRSGGQTKIVDSVLSNIETELLANAALQSKAYARSLRNFEQRIVQLRKDKRENAELQTYFERLHQIYAELDEPDGMEGVSAFVISPSLEHQIREHEETGRWTSAQSCWEVRLQQSPEDVTLHVGLLKCLRNLGHYDTLRTHIRGVLSLHPEWSQELAPFEAEAAWSVGDWATVDNVAKRGNPMAAVMLALHDDRGLDSALQRARRAIGSSISAKQYQRVYDPILGLHMLREVEMIHQAKNSISTVPDPLNRQVIVQQLARDLTRSLSSRLDNSSPAFRHSEAILSIRRTAFSTVKTPILLPELGRSWIISSKIARKAGYEQTAYSATLQAREANAPFAFIQQAKLLRAHGGALKALNDLENAVRPLLKDDIVDLTVPQDVATARQGGVANERFEWDRNLAKAVLLEARWAHETGRFETNDIVIRHQRAIQLAPNFESAYYHLGHFYDNLSGTPDATSGFNYFTCHNYTQALRHGVKYIYRTMPRMLTIWLDLGDHRVQDYTKWPQQKINLDKITKLVDKERKELPTYQFLTAYPQIVSRIGHPNKDLAGVLKKIMAAVIVKYPLQSLWPTVGMMQSKRAERKTLCQSVLSRVQGAHGMTSMVKDAERLSSNLLRMSNDKIEDKRKDVSIATTFPYIVTEKVFPSRMIIPLQDSLTCTLPSSSDAVYSHVPFPYQPVYIKGMEDRVDVMPSLQRPKKIVLTGSDGSKYPFLCKPHDDLRKDARLMDFNAMINKLLKSASESRRRQLYIRTYAVMPLNEECGLLEWVSNTNALKNILEKEYAKQGKRVYTSDLHRLLEQNKTKGHVVQIKTFKEQILPMFNPTVFHEWFLTTWPEPSAWLASRMAYSRTLAVMSMVGYVLGLGDRHGENILFDGLSGDTVHVDLNCLFEKGRTFEIPERVPFRLTQNMVDALGVTGVEGVFRKAAEISLDILRSNSESLMSVLEAFAHDPLVEWTKSSRNKTDKDIRNSADRNLKPIKAKLRGIIGDGTVVSVPNQVEALIKEATDPSNLAVMYQGWAPWL